MAKQAKITVHPKFKIGEIDERLFSAFLEPIGTMVKGTSMVTKVDSETFDIPGYAVEDTSQYTGKEGVNYIDAVSAWDEENGTLIIFVMNKSEDSDYPLNIDIKGFGDYVFKSATELYGKDLEKKSSFEDECFLPQRKIDIEENNKEFKTTLKALSWNVFCFEKGTIV